MIWLSYLILTAVMLALLAGGTFMGWKRMRNLLTSRAPPVIDDHGDDVKERLTRAFEQQYAASEELQEIVRKVLAENDRLRRYHAGGDNAPWSAP